jgi:hypothetical protein
MASYLGNNASAFDLSKVLPSLFIDNFLKAEATLYYHQNMLGDFIPNDLIARLLGQAARNTNAPPEVVQVWRTMAEQQGIHGILPQLIGKPTCVGHTPVTSALCSVTCDSKCDPHAKAFCAATSANVAADVDFLDPVIIDGCSCLQSPFTAWVKSLSGTVPDSALKIISNPPCLDGGRCNQYGYKTIEHVVQAQQCPMICSNVFQIAGANVNSSNNTQSCSISENTNMPVVMINRQRINTTDSDNVSVYDPLLKQTIVLAGKRPLNTP